VVDVAFGWYHEAYVDAKGKLWVCKKPKLASIKVEEIDEKDRQGLIELNEKIPGKPKIRQATFTRQRLFVLTEKGEVFVLKIDEKMTSMEDMIIEHIIKGPPQIEATLQTDNPIHVRDLKNIKMLSSGSDHLIALTYDGKVWAMGDDTFGQCG
jgi:alpha-tubulin suppressor-like RCC1 family protein